jgi:arylsulfatase A-like enzyme
MKTTSTTYNLYFGLSMLLAAVTTIGTPAAAQQQKPNIVIIWGDDIGLSDISAHSQGLMGFRTPNIDRIAREGVLFTDYYGEQSCTAGRASFITGQSGLRTGMTKVGLSGATLGLQKEDPTIAELLKPLGYATGQFGKNHLGDRNEFLPTVHGFDEFYGNLYHLNAEEEPELPDYPKDPAFRAKYGPARRNGLQGFGPRRPDRRSALRQGRQAGLYRHRPADQGADGDYRRQHH